MKKLIFYSIVIFFFLAGCTPFEPDEANYKQAAVPAPAPAQDLTSVTVYLNGNEPPESRAMNKALAEMGCDYFEVVFVWRDNTNATGSARGQWRIGEKATVTGVYTGTTGGSVDYGSVSLPASLSSNKGSAILLAGKSDKTLMAIGKLPTGTTINANTISVTFELNAIKAAVAETSSSSFLTAVRGSPPSSTGQVNWGNTVTTHEEIIAGQYFLAFKLDPKISAIKATYEFFLHSGSFNTSYTDGLRVAAKGTVEKKYPSYTMPEGGNINVNAIIVLDERTTVSMDNNQTPDNAFNPIVQFTFNTNNPTEETIPGSIFALVFEIPVYALVTDCVWYIRPGYGVLKYELDDGLGGMGGAVLIKTGDIVLPPVTTSFKIKITHVPYKWRYRWSLSPSGNPSISGRTANPPNESSTATTDFNPRYTEYDRVFRVTGLVVKMQDLAGNNITTYPHGSIVDATGTINNNALTFIVGKERILENSYIPNEFYGLVEVTVKFTEPDSAVSDDEKFFIMVSGNYYASAPNLNNSTYHYDFADPYEMNRRISNVATATQFHDTVSDSVGGLSNKNYIRIIRLTGANNNIDIVESALNVNPGSGNLVNGDPSLAEAMLYIVVASDSNIRLGRASNGRGGGEQLKFRGDRSGLVGFYFGRWPFDGLLNSPTILNTAVINTNPDDDATRDFTVNAGGYATESINRHTNKMITDGTAADSGAGGGIYNVDLGEGVTVLYPGYLH